MKMKLDETIFDKLAEILKKHELSEIEYKDDDVKIRLTKGSVAQGSPKEIEVREVKQFPAEVEPEAREIKKDWSDHAGAVKSPVVGTCYLAPEPGAQNFVVLGDMVQKDQPLLIIEAMKVMNLIKAPRDGKIVHVAVSNAEPVEYGQLLVVIE